MRRRIQFTTDITRSLAVRIDAYADAKGMPAYEAGALLLDAGLRAYERAVAAGKARAATFTAEQGRAAVSVRWAAKRQRKPQP
jgi:hypothetical protein